MNLRPYDSGECDNAHDEMRDAVRMASRYMPHGGPLTFRPDSTAVAREAWSLWVKDVFAKELAPHLIAVFQDTKQMRVREAIELDRTLECGIGEDEKRSLRSAGFQIFAEMENAHQIRPLERLRDAVQEGLAAGNFVTVFGMICAMFNLSLAACLTAYLYCEWRSGVTALANLDFRVTEEGFQEFARAARPALCHAMKPNVEAGETVHPIVGIVK